MASQPALRHATWDVVDLHWKHGPSPVQCVFRQSGAAGWQPWVIVARSAIMARAGREGLGLYAARTLDRDAYVGKYDGRVVKNFPSREAAMESVEAKRLLARGHDKMITRKSARGSGVELVDGEDAGAPFLHRINDFRGSGRRENARLTEGGWIQITKSHIPRFDLNRGVDANLSSELCFDYDNEYWRLGSKDYPVDLEF